MFLLLDPCFALGVLEGTRAASGTPLVTGDADEPAEAPGQRLALAAKGEDAPRFGGDGPRGGDRSFGLRGAVRDAAGE